MLKRLLILTLSIFLFFNFAFVAFAQKTPVPSPSPTTGPVDSFSLFWPMSAGKTIEDNLYFLKTLKENVRGFFIFGSAQKSDYQLFLSIKRMLESESLMKQNKTDSANKTLDMANDQLNKATSSLEKAKNSSDIDKNTKDEINTRVSNLKIFTNSLVKQFPEYNGKLQEVLDKLNLITV